jgi:hypothetical protein
MLPGFRFLFAAVILSMSILVFGLGAAALLRAAHEEFANLPTRRAPPEPIFARQIEPVLPTLALLRVEPPEIEKPADDVPAAAAPEIAPDILAPAEQVSEAAPPEPDKLAAARPEEPMQAETAKPETPATEEKAESLAAPAEAEAPAADAEVNKLAAVAEMPEPAATAPPPEPVTDVLALEGNIAATRIATLGGPAVIVDEKTSAKTTEAKADRSAVRKRAAQRARERRRIARRARLAREAAALAAQQQQQADPFAQAPVARRTR